jgi:hypothetical protein
VVHTKMNTIAMIRLVIIYSLRNLRIVKLELKPGLFMQRTVLMSDHNVRQPFTFIY